MTKNTSLSSSAKGPLVSAIFKSSKIVDIVQMYNYTLNFSRVVCLPHPPSPSLELVSFSFGFLNSPTPELDLLMENSIILCGLQFLLLNAASLPKLNLLMWKLGPVHFWHPQFFVPTPPPPNTHTHTPPPDENFSWRQESLAESSAEHREVTVSF